VDHTLHPLRFMTILPSSHLAVLVVSLRAHMVTVLTGCRLRTIQPIRINVTKTSVFVKRKNVNRKWTCVGFTMKNCQKSTE
jgi:hypothetical protein